MKQVQNGVATEVKSLRDVAIEGVSYVVAVSVLAGAMVTGHKMRVAVAKKVWRAIRK